MDTTFAFPAGDVKPLHPLSPERVNAAHAQSTKRPTTKGATTKSTTATENEPETYDTVSPQSSPSRRAKANLFADYNPASGTPNQVSGFVLPQSPSLPEIHALRPHVRTNSDVQGLVKRFEHLDVRDRDAENAERRKRHEAELRRAQMAREEAESDVKRLREEMRRLKKDCDDGRERERKVARRLEVVMEEFAGSKEAHTHHASVYEKEIRKARKEAFKSSSAVLKLQEELKSARQSLRITQSSLELEKEKVQRKEQERFEMEYQLIPLQEQLEKLKQQLCVVEEEKEALKTNLKEEEVVKIAAEGMIALPGPQGIEDDLFSSPHKSPQRRAPSPLSDDKENMQTIPKKALESRRLAEELEREKMRREHAEELADFLRMECVFRCCGCKMSSGFGHDFALALDAEIAAGIEKIKSGMETILAPLRDVDDEKMQVEPDIGTTKERSATQIIDISMEHPIDEPVEYETAIENMDRSLHFAVEENNPPDSPSGQLKEEQDRASPAPLPAPMNPAFESEQATSSSGATNVPVNLSPPLTPVHHQKSTPFRNQPSIRTVTTTTTVPMQFTPAAKPAPRAPALEDNESENIPPSGNENGATTAQPTFDRAAALAAIEYRRGRAKSIANGHMTPRKQMLEGVKERRDISAPALGQKVGGAASAGTAKGAASVGRNAGRKMV